MGFDLSDFKIAKSVSGISSQFWFPGVSLRELNLHLGHFYKMVVDVFWLALIQMEVQPLAVVPLVVEIEN